MNFTNMALRKIKDLGVFKGDVLWTINHGFGFKTTKGGKKYHHPATNLYAVVDDDTVVTVYHHDEHNDTMHTIRSYKHGDFLVRRCSLKAMEANGLNAEDISKAIDEADLEDSIFWPEYRYSIFNPIYGMSIQVCKETKEIVYVALTKKKGKK